MTLSIDDLALPQEIAAELHKLRGTCELLSFSTKGQNGYVFTAYNTILARKTAIKFYYWADGVRAHLEPKSLAALQSPHIVQVLDASFVGEEWAFFIMPFYENGDLDEYLGKTCFGLRQAIGFVAGLLEGVIALHSAGFVHRDLKPENLLVTNDCKPLIADFGSVRTIPHGENSVPGSGHAILYRPPESFESNRYDRRGDIYQCGMVLFQVLGGTLKYDYLPYLDRNEKAQLDMVEDEFDKGRIIDDAIKKKAVSGRLWELKTLPMFVPDAIKRIIRKATAVKVEDRYTTTSAFLSALNAELHKCADWKIENGSPIIVRGERKFRVCRRGTSFCVEQDTGNGKGWRLVPNSTSTTLTTAIKSATTCGKK